MSKTYLEAANTLPIYDDCDILVVGGGAAGHSAAVAAARSGAKKVILMERYGYFGGNVTGGYVLMLPALSWRKYSMVRGLQEEWFTRLDKNQPDAYIAPGFDEIGSTDPVLLHRWDSVHGNTISDSTTYNRLIRAPYFEPNHVKLEMDAMVTEEPNIKVLLHCWGTRPIMEGNTIKGVIFESKEGRKCIMAKVVIDATGDGDIYSQTGAPFTTKEVPEALVFRTALVWRMGGLDYEGYHQWRRQYPELALKFREGLSKIAGYPTLFFTDGRNDVVWFNNWILNKSCINLEDIRETELMVRGSIRAIIDYCKRALPTVFRNAFLYDIAPQLGTRSARRLEGEHILTLLDFACQTKFDDVIAWHSVLPMVTDGAPVEIPYRSILPRNIENLLCPGRHLSCDEKAISMLYLVPQCVGTGQAAGVAAAVAVQDGTTTHRVDIRRVQKILCYEQDVPLPRQENTNPELVKELEECEYGTMTPQAKKLREEAGMDW